MNKEWDEMNDKLDKLGLYWRSTMTAEQELAFYKLSWERIDCGFRAKDCTCAHPMNGTPECHPWACPLVKHQGAK